ncbi:hypothetical protein PP419_gp16 [Microbacterium phage vB_MoxS-R1]|uniref:Uncharacterized protein n=1 Tax=Microbacterium phage vB_MoxS-R1 TaxID=2848881 RepID=A0A8F2E4Q5_9CAUD|nr:hypothetical protein PP419_gp16 [Microbacterium phage vB_MoxS-R1]QWT28866.1 hypothetical protein vBMoxSR1_gp16 [Microbacterium phage vB_MoxS-R1]
MTMNSIPPVLVERADTRPIRLVPLRDIYDIDRTD